MVTKPRSSTSYKFSLLLIKLICLTLSGIMLYILFRHNFLVKPVPSRQAKLQPFVINTKNIIDSKAEQIDLSSWQYILVNYNHPVTQKFIDNLKLVNIPKGYGPQLQVDERIYSQLEQMLSAAKADGVELYICSAFRSVEYQTKLFNNKVNEQLNRGPSK
ncbi:MAG: D-alanyl-D-alanine carboxypeptidase family protein, partial [Oscillospiraceae bacterium]